MKKFTLLFLFLSFSLLTFAQSPEQLTPDLLILQSGHTISCRILSADNKHYKIQVVDPDGSIREVEYPKRYVRSVQYSGKGIEELPQTVRQSEHSGSAFRFRLTTGYSVRLGKLMPGIRSDFRSGFIIGISPGFVLRNGPTELGLVADYRRHGYSMDGWDGRIGVNTFFIGPAVTGLYPTRNSKSFTGFELAAGYAYYGERYNEKTIGEGNTFGLKTSFIYGFPLGKKAEERLEFRLSLLSAYIKKFTVLGQKLESDETLTLSSINFTIGFTFGY